MVVDNDIITWLAMTVEDHRVARDRLGEIFGRCLGVFYANDGMVGPCEPEWMQNAMNVLVGLFRRYGLAANVSKSHKMTCQLGALQSGMSEEATALKCTSVGDLYRVILQRRTPCLKCGVDLTKGSMTSHRRRMHGMEPAIDWIRLLVSQTEHQHQVYDVSFLRLTKRCPCPLPI